MLRPYTQLLLANAALAFALVVVVFHAPPLSAAIGALAGAVALYGAQALWSWGRSIRRGSGRAPRLGGLEARTTSGGAETAAAPGDPP